MLQVGHKGVGGICVIAIFDSQQNSHPPLQPKYKTWQEGTKHSNISWPSASNDMTVDKQTKKKYICVFKQCQEEKGDFLMC